MFGESLYANFCEGTITDADPIPVETDRIPVTGGSISWIEAPADDSAAGPSTISIAGLEVTKSDGELVLGHFDDHQQVLRIGGQLRDHLRPC